MPPRPSEVEFVDDAERDPDLLSRVYAEVLQGSFEPDELPSLGEFVSPTHGSRVMVAMTAGDPVGVAVVDSHTDGPLVLLSYLAIRPGLRASGIGSRIIERLRTSWWSDGGASIVLGEVHDPRFWPTTAGEQPAARLRFYERHGAQLVPVPWVQPRVRRSGERVPGMLLLALGGDPSLGEFPASWLVEWMLGYYIGAESLTDPRQDPTVAALVARAEERVTIRLRPLADHTSLAPLAVPEG